MPINPLKAMEYFRLVGAATPEGLLKLYFQVRAVEPGDYETNTTDTAEFTAVASAAQSGFRNISVLKPNESPFHMYYVVPGFKDGCKYQIKIPNGSDRLGLDEDQDVARLDNIKSPYYAPSPRFAFYLLPDQWPAINAINPTPRTITPKVFFLVEKYDILHVTDQRILTQLENFDLGDKPFIPSTKLTIGGVKA